jgi:hypothetical protein
VLRDYEENNWGSQVSSVQDSEEMSQRQLVKKAVGREQPFTEDLSIEAEE